MSWNFRLRPRLGPFHVNISRRGLRSVSFTLGPYTKNLRTGRSSFDSPGPGSFQWGGKPRNQQRGSGIRFVIALFLTFGLLLLCAAGAVYLMFVMR